MEPDKFKNFISDTKGHMEESIGLAEEISACNRLIDSPNVPENIKQEMRQWKDRALKNKIGIDGHVLKKMSENNKE